MKNFILLTTSLFLLNSAANAACPDAAFINTAIGDTKSYEGFKEDMKSHGGVLRHIHFDHNSINYAQDWHSFQTLTQRFPLVFRSENTRQCIYSVTTPHNGRVVVRLNWQKD